MDTQPKTPSIQFTLRRMLLVPVAFACAFAATRYAPGQDEVSAVLMAAAFGGVVLVFRRAHVLGLAGALTGAMVAALVWRHAVIDQYLYWHAWGVEARGKMLVWMVVGSVLGDVIVHVPAILRWRKARSRKAANGDMPQVTAGEANEDESKHRHQRIKGDNE